jgi:hypothetical protein
VPQTDLRQVADDIRRITSAVVWCTATTVGPEGRPRSRILHPIFVLQPDRPVGWVVTARSPVKTAHLSANPHVACSYWSPSQDTVQLDCVASWVDDPAEQVAVFELFSSTPPPLGYDLSGFGPDGAASEHFTPLRLDAWRAQVLTGESFAAQQFEPTVWTDRSLLASLP